jgi:hypothetical protein
MTRTFHLVVVLVIAIGVGPAMAQQPTSERAAWQALAESLEPGAFVEVVTMDGKHVKGTVLQHEPGGLLLKPKTRIPVPARVLTYADISSIERSKQGMSPAMKTLLGVGVGVGGTALVGFIALLSSSY